MRHFAMALFNRATLGRMDSLLKHLHEDRGVKFTLYLGSTILDKNYGKTEEYIRKEYPNFNICSLPYDSYENDPNRVSSISSDILKNLSKALQDDKPELLFVVADRFETLPAAMASSYNNIPTIHIQGGEISGNIDEKVRHAVTKLADYHFSNTAIAKRYIAAMGEEPVRIYNTGCPSLDFIKTNRIYRWTPAERYIVCFMHPDTNNLETQLKDTEVLLKSIIDFCYKKTCKCIWYWPNADQGREDLIKLITTYHEKYPHYLIKAINKDPFDFLRELAGSKFLVGNSSTGIRECSYIGIPVVNIGERQQYRERSWNVVDCDPDYPKLMETFTHQWNAKRYKRSYLFGHGESAKKITSITKRLDLKLKGPLTYPNLYEYRDDHIGEQKYVLYNFRYKTSKAVGDQGT